MAQKKGRPDGWSEQLWRTYCAYGEADQKHIASCNRFLNAMLHLYPEQLIELIQELTESGTEDELDLYRAWYKRHIKWPKECVCEIQGSFTDPHGDPLMDFDEVTGEFAAPTQVRPWFLGAAIQLAGHLAKGEVPEPKQGLLSEPKTYDTKAKIRKYLTESGWAVDQLFLEKAPAVWIPNDTRSPDESLKNFINRLVISFSLLMSIQIAEKAWARPDRVALQGRPLNPAKGYERMCVRRMFGEKIPEIVEVEKPWLADKKGRFTRSPDSAEREVRRRSNEAAKRLGIKLSAAKKTS